VSLSSLKITSRTLFKVKIQNKIRCAQFGKIKEMTWQKDAFSDDAWRCRVTLDLHSAFVVTRYKGAHARMTQFLQGVPRDAMQAWPMSSRGFCPCVCLSRSWIVSKRVKYLQIVFITNSQAILVSVYQMAWQYSDGNAPNGGVECRWGRRKSRFSTNNWLCDR